MTEPQMQNDELVEKVAKALYATHGYIYDDEARMFEPFPWEEADDCIKDGHRREARAAIAVMREAGYVKQPPGKLPMWTDNPNRCVSGATFPAISK